MSTIPSLPNELILQIIRHVLPAFSVAGLRSVDTIFNPNADALSLCLVSQLFRDLTQPLLYLKIRVGTSLGSKLLADSGAFSTQRTEHFELATSRYSNETLRRLVQVAGTKALEVLKADVVGPFDWSILEAKVSQPRIKYSRWRAQELVELPVPARALPPGRLEDSPTRVPLRNHCRFRFDHDVFDDRHPFLSNYLSPPVSLPCLPSLATGITSLTIAHLARALTEFALDATTKHLIRTNLSLFSAVTHLTVQTYDMGDVIDILALFPPEVESNVTHLSLHFEHDTRDPDTRLEVAELQEGWNNAIRVPEDVQKDGAGVLAVFV
ncbi:hypothetical protein P7C70_g6659, partial [Phenoliferia sp. Uapishka_3]